MLLVKRESTFSKQKYWMKESVSKKFDMRMDTSSSEIFNDCKAMTTKEITYKCNQCDYSSVYAGNLTL